MKKQAILTVIVLFLVLAVQAQPFDFKAGGFVLTEYTIELPYQNINGKIIVEVVLKNKKRRFLLDTGAPLAISQQLFDELSPAILTKQLISDINQKSDSLFFVSIDSLSFNGVLATGIPAIVLNNNPILDCLKLDGFLGSNILRNSVVQFDSRNQVISITDDISKLFKDELTGSEMLLDGQASPFLKFNIGKKISEYVMFDSGSDVFYSMSQEKVKKFSRAKDFTLIHEAEGSNQVGLYGVANKEKTSLLRIPYIQLNTARFYNIISETSNNNNSRIGSAVLDYGLLTLDYKEKKFYFNKFEENASFENRQFQISPTFMDNKLCVGKIWAKELERMISVGDEIISVNDWPVHDLSLCDALNGELRNENSKMKIEVKRREGSVVSVTIEAIK